MDELTRAIAAALEDGREIHLAFSYGSREWILSMKPEEASNE